MPLNAGLPPMAANDPWLMQANRPSNQPSAGGQPQSPKVPIVRRPEPGLGDPFQDLIQLVVNGLKGTGQAMYNNFGPPGLGGAIAEPIARGISDFIAPMSPEMIQRQDQRFNSGIAGMDQQINQNNMNNERLRQIFMQPPANAPNPRTYQLPQQPTPAAPVSSAQLFPGKVQAQKPNYLDSLFLPPKPTGQAQGTGKPVVNQQSFLAPQR